MYRPSRRDMYSYDMDYPPPAPRETRGYRYERSPSPQQAVIRYVDEPQETLQRVYYDDYPPPRRARSLTPPRRYVRRASSPPQVRYRARSLTPPQRYVVQKPPPRYAFSFQDERPEPAYVRERPQPRQQPQYVYEYEESDYGDDYYYEDNRDDLYRFNQMRAELNERREPYREPRVVYESYAPEPRREVRERIVTIPRTQRVAPEANYADAYLVKDMDLYGKKEKILYETRNEMPAFRHEDVHALRDGPSLSFYRPRGNPRY